MPRYNRKVTPKVVGGRPQRKNRHDLTPNIWTGTGDGPRIERERAGRGYRHLLRKSDITDFIAMIPNWGEISEGLNGVLLANGEDGLDGWYDYAGVIGICAWHRDIWVEARRRYYVEHRPVFKRLGLEYEKKDDFILLKFTEDQARAYQLLHIFLHELGHHHDRMTTKKKKHSGRGEPYAEGYALEFEKEIWDQYLSRFKLD